MNSRHDKQNTKTTTLKPLARIGSWAQLRTEVPHKDKVPAKKGEGRGKALEKEKTTSLETEKRLGKEEKKQSKKDDKKEKPQAPRFPSSRSFEAGALAAISAWLRSLRPGED